MFGLYKIGIASQVIPTNKRREVINISVKRNKISDFPTSRFYCVPVPCKENHNSVVLSDLSCIGVAQEGLINGFTCCILVKEQVDICLSKPKPFDQHVSHSLCIVAGVI